MAKAELISIMMEKTGWTRSQAEEAFQATFETITDLMAKKEKVMISKFGAFSTKVRKERKGRHPLTGKEMIIPATIVASFKPATQLKETLNEEKS